MDLTELCSLHGTTPASGSVPAWTLGCFRRRSITYFNGDEDQTTLVLWLQSRGLTFDLRLAPDRPRPQSQAELSRLSSAELLRLVQVEGGVSPSRFEPSPTSGVELAGTMHWLDWTAFQLHAKWPEPGVLRRVGDCLIEHAPSGAYVEDWRLQPSGAGPLVGLRLIEERDASSGELLHRGGGLVVAGEHALWVRGRARDLPGALRLEELVPRARRDAALLEVIFGFEASYAVRDAKGDYLVSASTLPWREGRPLISFQGFTVDGGVVTQSTREEQRQVERRFVIDTLEPDCEDWLATPATASAVEWLKAEEHTLLRTARSR